MAENQNTFSSTTENSSDSHDLEEIEAAIKRYQATCNQSYIAIGRLLLEAKGKFGKHGEWLEWLRNHVDIPICKAQRLMKVAKWLEGNEAPVSYLDFTKAYILSRLTGNDLKIFLQNWHHVGGPCPKQVKDMTKRELELAVRNHLRRKRNNGAAPKVPQNPALPAVPRDNFLSQISKMKDSLHDLVDYVAENESNSDDYEPFIKELCDLCSDIVQQLSPNAVEDD